MTLMIGAASRLILQLHNRVFTLERRVSFNGVCCLIWYMKSLKNCLISGVELAFSSCLTAAINMLRSSISSPGASTNINVPLKNLEEYKKYLLVQSKSCEMKFPSQIHFKQVIIPFSCSLQSLQMLKFPNNPNLFFLCLNWKLKGLNFDPILIIKSQIQFYKRQNEEN